MAEASSFLKGQNNRNWFASFDWLIKDANMVKVLDGNYTDKHAIEKLHTEKFEYPEYYNHLKKRELTREEKKLLGVTN
jgi:hypothetical protein